MVEDGEEMGQVQEQREGEFVPARVLMYRASVREVFLPLITSNRLRSREKWF